LAPIQEKLKEELVKKTLKINLEIALKEADETKYWLEILEATGRDVPTELMNKCEELIRILVAIIKNS